VEPIDPQKRRSMRAAGRLSAVGWELAISVIACFLAGIWADGKLGTEPWLAIVGLVIGMGAGFWILFKAVRAANEAAEEEDRGGGSSD
jgi:ATP synthase protein I